MACSLSEITSRAARPVCSSSAFVHSRATAQAMMNGLSSGQMIETYSLIARPTATRASTTSGAR
jgi:hypothetical protein